MAAAYTKEFLVNAFVHRYRSLDQDKVVSLRNMANSFYDDVGRDKFRIYCSLDAQAIREYRACL